VTSAFNPPSPARSRLRWFRQRPLLAVGALATVLLLATACGTASPAASSTSAAGSRSAAASAAPGTINCSYEPGGRAAKEVELPAENEPTVGPETASVNLTGGTVTIDLDRATAPCTVGSFVHLAQAGYYDDTPCHRLTKAASLSVLQCGDPSGTGGGGPGYSFADETNPDMVYPAGTVAMANAGPDTNGSQFFLVYEDSKLPPDYTVFGTMTEGLDVLRAIAAKGASGGGKDGAPINPITISTVTVADGTG
jgi:peptidyl-prolyl cis-trans isomerase B (cyclophilin B)